MKNVLVSREDLIRIYLAYTAEIMSSDTAEYISSATAEYISSASKMLWSS